MTWPSCLHKTISQTFYILSNTNNIKSTRPQTKIIKSQYNNEHNMKQNMKWICVTVAQILFNGTCQSKYEWHTRSLF